MASILDAGIVGIFSGIFTFLLVYAIVWGVLSWKKPFGKENTGTYAIIAVAIALMMSIAAPARSFISFIAPWYIAFAIVIFFILFLVGMFGLSSEKDFPNIIKDGRTYTWIIIICIIIFVAGLAVTFGQTTLAAGGNAPSASGQTGSGSGTDVIGGPGSAYQSPGTIGAGTGGQISTGSGQPVAGQPGSTATSNFQTNMLNTILHPKVLGLLITFIIAAVAIYFLSAN